MAGPAEPARAGRLLLAATPLGNPGDASTRLRQALESVPVIAAEDTRRLRRLCNDLGVQPVGRIVSFFDANESQRVPSLVEALAAGEDVLVVSDAGMPSISDPGYRLVAATIEAGFSITVLPGPSAVLASVALSGLPVDRFTFEGFLPRRAAERRRTLAELVGERRTMVFFEAPHRLEASLADLAGAFGDTRAAAVCRELTKTYEEVRRGTLGELTGWAAGGVRGEITIVVAGAPAVPVSGAVDLSAEVARREEAGVARKDAIADVAREYAVPKRQVFDAVVAAKRSGPDGA